MRRLLVPLAALAAIAVAVPFTASASGDFGCTPSWKLNHGNLSGCDDMAMLGPGNDTRTNLAFLLFDRRGQAPVPGKGPQPSEPLPLLFDWRTLSAWLTQRANDDTGPWSDGEGSRCRSNETGATAFAAAIGAAKLPDGEGAKLIAFRNSLKPECSKPGTGGYDVESSSAARGFAIYLAGAQAFYAGDYDAADKQFASLDGSPNMWLRETGRYMLARVGVNRIQVGIFDEYGNLKGKESIDQKRVAAAETGLLTYLKAYPQGQYAKSARGLLRRVYWFGGQRDKLAAQYAGLIALAPPARGLDDADLAEELDTKLLPDLTTSDTTDPTLLAVLDLRRMRAAQDDTDAGCCTNPLTLADLNGQKGAFAKDPALFEFLQAAHAFYTAKKPADVLRLIPDAAKQPQFSSVQFSRQMLRGMALEAVGDRNARGFWLEMLPGAKLDAQRAAIELALAMHDERAGAVGKVFEPGSPVGNQTIREILLINVADAALLRMQTKLGKTPHEREVALFVLLYKELSRGGYKGFLSDVTLVPGDAPEDVSWDLIGSEKAPSGVFTKSTRLGDFDCPALRKTAAALAAAPGDMHAQLCLADFFRDNGFDQIPIDAQPAKDELGGTPTLFAGPVYARLEVYKRIIASPAAAADDKAYALYRAINCYGPSGNNSCSGVEVPKATRKAWFQQLKTTYAKSRWAIAQRIYW